MAAHRAIFRIFLAATLFATTASWARLSGPHLSHRSNSLLHSTHRRNISALTPPKLEKRTIVPGGSDPQELVKRDGTKYVFMHHIVGNTYPYTAEDWEKDIRAIDAKGIDAIALNIGSSDWQRTQVQTAYTVAASIRSNLKLFYSFDLTEMPCDLNDIVARIRLYEDHPSQFKLDGKTFVSSYAGDCLTDAGWESLKTQTDAYIMPFMWGLEEKFGQWGSLDSWYCWGCAWPQGDYDKNTDDDNYYMAQLPGKYAATISPWMFTHYSYKNFYLRGDNWLINNRWEQLVAMRDRLTFIELLTWNDYGESDYYGPVRGAQPDGTYWADDFPHTAWFDMSDYYIKAFKTGTYPEITQDVVYYWSKTHPADASASNEIYPRPTGGDWSLDYLWAAVFATSPAQVTLAMGSSSQTFSVDAGVSKIQLPAAPGSIRVQMSRGGQVIASAAPTDFVYVSNPQKYNYNAYVGAAIASSPTSTPTATSTPTSATPSSTSTTTATAAPTTSSVPNSWTYKGCYEDPTDNRVLANGLFTSQPSNTISTCLSSCIAQGYQFGGVEYSKECFCSSVIRTDAVLTADGECNAPCAGNALETCGSGNRIAVYSSPVPTTPTTPPTPSTTSVAGSTWTYVGCLVDNVAQRTLFDGGSTSTDTNTVSNCLTTCSSRGFAFGGVEYGRECWCGTQIRGGVAVTPDGQCNMACSGNGNEKCGDGDRIAVFSRALTAPTPTSTISVTDFSPKGCIAEGSTGTRRALTQASYVRSDMTPQVCNSLCSAYQYSGVEYGFECYCGSSLTNNGATGDTISDSNCDSTCSGDSSQKCGGGWTMNLSQKTTASWNDMGCYVDGGSSMLRGYSTTNSAMTTEMCLGICLERGFTMAATQNGEQCFCGNQLYTSGSVGLPTGAGECNVSCQGNAAETCGASLRNNLYTRV